MLKFSTVGLATQTKNSNADIVLYKTVALAGRQVEGDCDDLHLVDCIVPAADEHEPVLEAAVAGAAKRSIVIHSTLTSIPLPAPPSGTLSSLLSWLLSAISGSQKITGVLAVLLLLPAGSRRPSPGSCGPRCSPSAPLRSPVPISDPPLKADPRSPVAVVTVTNYVS